MGSRTEGFSAADAKCRRGDATCLFRAACNHHHREAFILRRRDIGILTIALSVYSTDMLLHLAH